ncbi:MAG: hypothetical protein ABID61_04590 [Candidatus Micrarchaeota archaeon]
MEPRTLKFGIRMKELVAARRGWPKFEPLRVMPPRLTREEQEAVNLRLIRAETVEQARDALKDGADINCGVQNKSRGIDNATVLIFAVIDDKPELVEFYLEQPGIGINKKDNDGYSAIMHAEFHGRERIVTALRTKGATFTEEDRQKIYNLKLIRAETVEQARDALENGADINCSVQNTFIGIRDASVLIFAVIDDKPELFDFYLEQPGIDIHRKDDNGFSAIMRAEFRGRPEMIAKLRAKGTTFTEEDRKKVYTLRLIRAETVEQARDALEHGADINTGVWQKDQLSNASVLIATVIRNSSKLFDFYLSQPGIDVNKRDAFGWNVLMYAVHHKRTSMERALRKSLTLSRAEEEAVTAYKAYRPE